MKVVRGRADARWLPGRFNFGLFRLYAFIRMKTATPEPRDVALVIDRNQNRIESFIIGSWATLTLACYASETLFASWPLPLALLAGIVAGLTFLQIPIIAVGLMRRTEKNNGLNSVVLMTLLVALAIHFARAQSFAHSWIRYAAWQFLGLLALNAAAAGVVFLLRGAIQEMEHAVGGLTSEL
ncbi:MAG TPA: hypothetical protein VF883_04425 [Thermoanaerobaculia bacterium]